MALQACIDATMLGRLLPHSVAHRESRLQHSALFHTHCPPASGPLSNPARSSGAVGTGGSVNRPVSAGNTHRAVRSQRSNGEQPPASRQNQSTKATPETGPHEYRHDVTLSVPAPLKQVWELWTDLESAPKWMPWITKVELSADAGASEEPGAVNLKGGEALHARPLSKWICSTSGFQIAWTARVTQVTEALHKSAPHCALEWATTEGLQSNGRVEFTPAEAGEDGRESTCIELKIVHSLPSALARVMDGSALGGLVRATLRSDLERFKQYVVESSAGIASADGKPAQQDHG